MDSIVKFCKSDIVRTTVDLVFTSVLVSSWIIVGYGKTNYSFLYATINLLYLFVRFVNNKFNNKILDIIEVIYLWLSVFSGFLLMFRVIHEIFKI